MGLVFEYNKMEMESAREMIIRRNSWKSEYLKFKENLIKKKEKVFPDKSKWELPHDLKLESMDKS